MSEYMQNWTVGNLRITNEGIRCDRRTALGNPFYMHNESERHPVCKGFDTYFNKIMYDWFEPEDAAEIVASKLNLVLAKNFVYPTYNNFYNIFIRLQNRKPSTLLCWCHPLECHCDVLIKYLNR